MVVFGGAEFILFWHVRIALLVFFSVVQLLEGRVCSFEQVSGHRVILEHKRYHGLGMDALVTPCSWKTTVILVRAWML